jgi:hypothetical protein
MEASDPKGEMLRLEDNEISFGNRDGPEANLVSRLFKVGTLRVSLADNRVCSTENWRPFGL